MPCTTAIAPHTERHKSTTTSEREPSFKFFAYNETLFQPIRPLKAANKSTLRNTPVVALVAASQFPSIKQAVAFLLAVDR
jgi:hypothetical protein